MPVNRRAFIGSLAAASLVPAMVATARNAAEVVPPQPSPSLPNGLRKGARVGVASPASGVTIRELHDFSTICASVGLVPVLGRNVKSAKGYLAAPDQDRADEFMEFIEDRTIDAIVCARGGYGVARILPMLDYGAIGQAQKPIVGFSDITALLIAANQLGGVVTFHGPVATSTFDTFTLDAFRGVLMPSETQAPYQYSNAALTTLAPGIARGRLTGGNLAVVASTLGTRYEIDTRGAILFLEEINEEPYQIDRLLTQLWLAGKLQQASGIALGNFRNCEGKKRSVYGPLPSLTDVLRDRLGTLGIPVLYGLPFGHVTSKLTIPIGVTAEVDATNKRFRLLGSAVI